MDSISRFKLNAKEVKDLIRKLTETLRKAEERNGMEYTSIVLNQADKSFYEIGPWLLAFGIDCWKSEKEKEIREKAILKERALKKLTTDEIEALGMKSMREMRV